MRRLFYLTLAITLLIMSAISEGAEHTKDGPAEVKANLKTATAHLVDVREVEEWNDGHLADASLYQLSDINDNPSKDELKKRFGQKKIVYLHCRSGGRVLFAAEVLKDKGYDIRPLKLGYADLLKAGFKKAD